MTDASKVEDRKVIAPFGVGSPRTVPMKVIVCSLSRTGTASMQEALKILGMPAYHSANMMAGRKEGLEHWTRTIDAKYGDQNNEEKTQKATALSRQAFDEILGEHMAVVDLPGSLFAPELAELYPDAKVIVLNRDVDAWFVSCRKAWPFRFSSFGIRVLTWVMYWDAKVLAIRTYLLKLHSAAWRFEWPDDDAELKAKEFFHNYYAECRDRIPADRRMEFSVQEGWAPLCRYLNVEVPTVRSPDTGEVVEIPFPRSNDAASFQKYQNNTFSSIVKGAVYGWIGRLSFVAAIGQAAYLSRGFWLPAVYMMQNKVRRLT